MLILKAWEWRDMIKRQYECNLIMMHDLIGGKWKLRILWHIMRGDNRFSMLEKAIDGITPKVLMTQLRELEESGLVIKHVIVSTPPKVVVYEINPEYLGLEQIVESIHDFSRRYIQKNRIDILTKK